MKELILWSKKILLKSQLRHLVRIFHFIYFLFLSFLIFSKVNLNQTEGGVGEEGEKKPIIHSVELLKVNKDHKTNKRSKYKANTKIEIPYQTNQTNQTNQLQNQFTHKINI